MDYSLTLPNAIRLSFGKSSTKSAIEWLVNINIFNDFSAYKEAYQVKNDITIFDLSYFNLLCENFKNQHFKIVDSNSFTHSIEQKIRFHRISFYQNLYQNEYNKIVNDENTIEVDNSDDIINLLDSNLLTEINESHTQEEQKIVDVRSVAIIDEPFLRSLENDTYPQHKIRLFADKLATQECEENNYFLSDYLDKIPLIFHEFKNFVLGFVTYLENKYANEYSSFRNCYHILLDDISYFKNSKINSLSKYKVVIGHSTEQRTGKRGKTDSFIPAGTCKYGEHIFINSHNLKLKYGSVNNKRYVKEVFYHEVGHALDFLYFNDTVLKKQQPLCRSSENLELLKICKRNYSQFKLLSSQLPKKYKLWLAYYIQPVEVKEQSIDVKGSIEFNKTILKLKQCYTETFDDILPEPQYIYKPNAQFSATIQKLSKFYNYSKPLHETWAEDFGIIFNWIKNGFNEQDKLVLEKGKSPNRILFKLHYDSLLYILENFQWSKLNFSHFVYLKRKSQIKQYLKHVKNMPLYLDSPRKRVIKSKKYLQYKDLIKK